MESASSRLSREFSSSSDLSRRASLTSNPPYRVPSGCIPFVVSALTHAALTAHLNDCATHFDLFEDANDLLLAPIFTLSHFALLCFILAGELYIKMGLFSGSRSAKARSRMQRLGQFRFEGEPLIIPTQRGNGQEAYALRSQWVPVIEQPVEEPKTPTIRAVPRQRIIEYSRNRYGKTREEVEKQIAELNGWTVRSNDQTQAAPETEASEPATRIEAEHPHRKELRRCLQNIGIAPDQIEYLFSNFEAERIEKQLGWLPFRQVRNPSAYLVAAIVHDYEEPIYRR